LRTYNIIFPDYHISQKVFRFIRFTAILENHLETVVTVIFTTAYEYANQGARKGARSVRLLGNGSGSAAISSDQPSNSRVSADGF